MHLSGLNAFIMEKNSNVVTVKIMHKAVHCEFLPHKSQYMLFFHLHFMFFMVQLLTFEQFLLVLQYCFICSWAELWKQNIPNISFHLTLQPEWISYPRWCVITRVSPCHGAFGYRPERIFSVVSKSSSQSITISPQLWSQAKAWREKKQTGVKRYAAKYKKTRASSSPSGFPPKGWLHTLVTHHLSNPRAWRGERKIACTKTYTLVRTHLHKQSVNMHTHTFIERRRSSLNDFLNPEREELNAKAAGKL